MMDRRRLLAATAALAAVGPQPGAARAAESRDTADDGFGTPAVTAPFAPEVYRERRQRVMTEMKTGVAVLHAAPVPASEFAPFRQDADFAWLTGLQGEPGAILVLAPGERTTREFLLLTPRNPETERWEGIRLSPGARLRQRTGFEAVSRTTSLGWLVTELAARAGELRYLGALAVPSAPLPPALELYGQVAARVPGTRIKLDHDLIRRLRAVKEPRELALVRQAIAATERGLFAAMRQARPGMREFELKQIIEAEFRAAGARSLAFPSIVATGRNTAVLHYTGGDATIAAGDMVLCDVGAEIGGYAADITRSFPVDGRFSHEQRAVYDSVLKAQETGMATLKAGVVYEDVHRAARDVLEAAGHRDDFWHGLGHFVGLEVHDVGNYALPLPAQSVFTIEPGIYLPERGFGMRIEDDFLVTASGNEHLSRAVPRRPDEIEALLAKR